MTKKQWHKLKLQIALGGKPDEDFFLKELWLHHCDRCKNYIGNKKRKTMMSCKYKNCDLRWLDTINKEGIVRYHTHLTGYYPELFDD